MKSFYKAHPQVCAGEVNKDNGNDNLCVMEMGFPFAQLELL